MDELFGECCGSGGSPLRLPNLLIEVFDLLLQPQLQVFSPSVQLGDFLIEPAIVAKTNLLEDLLLQGLELGIQSRNRHRQNRLPGFSRQVEKPPAGGRIKRAS